MSNDQTLVTIRRTTGRWAKSFIVDRLMLEARYQLIYTDRDVTEIAYQLHFHHPTHFGQFFRKY